MHYLVNLDTGEPVRRVSLNGRLRIPEIGCTISPVPVGLLWEDQPYAVIEAVLDDTVPAGHRITGDSASYDPDTETLTVTYETEAIPLEDQQEAKAAAIRAEGDRRLGLITASYTAKEIATWPQQAVEADAYGASQSADDAPMLAVMAAKRGITLAEMVGRVNAARAVFTAAAGAVLGAQQKLETDVWAAEDQAALDAIDPADPDNWPT